MSSPIVLVLYDPETNEEIKRLSQAFVPWKMLKRAIKLLKIDLSKPENLSEEDVDQLSDLVVDIFGGRVTREELEKNVDLNEMVTVLNAIATKTSGSMPKNAGAPGS